MCTWKMWMHTHAAPKTEKICMKFFKPIHMQYCGAMPSQQDYTAIAANMEQQNVEF